MPAGTTDGGEVHLGAPAHALVLRSSPWHTCGPSGIILGGLWVLGLLLSWLGLQGTGHLEGPWGRRTQASTRGASSDRGWSGVLLYVRAGPKGPGGEVPAPPSAAEWPENPECLRPTLTRGGLELELLSQNPKTGRTALAIGFRNSDR